MPGRRSAPTPTPEETIMSPEALLPQTKPTARVEFDGKSVSLPVVEGTEGERAIDIEKLRASTGLITLDPGYGNTGSCESKITFIDGEKGILRYRGYPIEELAEKSTFLEVAWLLMYGELPRAGELEGFRHEITMHTLLHENFRRFFEAMPKDAHPMPVSAAAVGRFPRSNSHATSRNVLFSASSAMSYPR
jgi:citrate synthase